jgi:hypothetical protein
VVFALRLLVMLLLPHLLIAICYCGLLVSDVAAVVDAIDCLLLCLLCLLLWLLCL